jgi:hypothetical protein
MGTKEAIRNMIEDEGFLKISTRDLTDDLLSSNPDGILDSTGITSVHKPSTCSLSERPGSPPRLTSSGNNQIHPADRV